MPIDPREIDDVVMTELRRITPGSEQFKKMNAVHEKLDVALSEGDLTVTESLSIIAALAANAAIQIAPESPCSAIHAIAALIHESIHSRLDTLGHTLN